MSLCPNCKMEMYEDGKYLRCHTCVYTKSNPAMESSPQGGKGSKNIQQVNEEITQLLVEARLGDVPVPWKAPWVALDKRNFDSGRRYTGLNRLFLSFTDDVNFITKESAEKQGKTLSEGSKAHLVIKWVPTYLTKEERLLPKEEQAEIGKKKRPFMAAHFVYKAKDFGLEKAVTGEKDNKKYASIEKFLETMPLRDVSLKEGSNSVGYSWAEDCIYLPKVTQFDSTDDYYRQLFKALAHATGTKSRLDRPDSKFKREDENGKEELIGEIASAYMCSYFGIPVGENDVAYIDGWLRAIEGDAYLLMSSAQQAEKIYKYLGFEE
jgi:antirestriction protein ArdC